MLMGFDKDFDNWWLVNKFKLMHDETVGLREIAHAGWDAGKSAAQKPTEHKKALSDETAFEVLAWYVSRSEPNTSRVYYECPICHATWHKDGLFGVERHNLDCWIPRLQGEVKAATGK